MLAQRMRMSGGLAPGYHGLVEFGTLKNGETEMALPTRPWRSDYGTTQYPDGGGSGNVPAQAGTNLNNYTFADTSATQANVLRWHHFVEKKGDYDYTQIFIADRCLIANCSWNHINGSDYISGKSVTIDGKDYTCRSLTGGPADRNNGSDGYYAGGKLPNEWDRYVMNGYGITGVTPPYYDGAPEPATTDWDTVASLAENNTVRKDTHNQAWHWIAMYTWCSDITTHDATRRADRGYHSARYWYPDLATRVDVYRGWRPALVI